MLLERCVQPIPRVTVMVLRDCASADAPQPHNPIRVRVIGRRGGQTQLARRRVQHPTNQPRARHGVSAQIVGDHAGDTAPRW